MLIVDDHADTLQLLKRLMERLGHTVYTAETIADAIAVIEPGAGDDAGRANANGKGAGVALDAIVSDIGLPDGTGHELMRRARAVRPELQGVAVSGYGMDHDVQASRDAGFAAHLVKPIDITRLDATLRELVHQRPQPVPT